MSRKNDKNEGDAASEGGPGSPLVSPPKTVEDTASIRIATQARAADEVPDFAKMPIEQVNEYLRQEGYDPEEVVARGMRFIEGLKARMTVRRVYPALFTLHAITDELCNAIDNGAEDIGGSRPIKEILSELGPAVDQASDALKFAMKLRVSGSEGANAVSSSSEGQPSDSEPVDTRPDQREGDAIIN